MKYVIIALLVLPALLMSLLPSQETDAVQQGMFAAPGPDGEAVTSYAVLELFTSQGCSSCPSADALLHELDEGNDQVIALSFHVDYWNYLGWEDPFSSKYYTARQSDYNDALRSRTYTPQLVVNGRAEMIGSRRAEVNRAVKSALAEGLTVQPTFTSTIAGRTITVEYRLPTVPAGHRVTALLVQPEATSAIRRGENKGRDLHHVNVVRAMEHERATATGMITLMAPEDLDPVEGEVILLVQDIATQAIVGVAK